MQRAKWLSVCAILLMAGVVQAAPLNLTMMLPDLNSSVDITTTYDATIDAFSVTATLNQYTEGDGTTRPAVGPASGGVSVTLDAEIDQNGNLVGGTLVIQGRVINNPPPGIFLEGTLLTATLTDFGFSGTGSQTLFEFLGTPAEVESETGLLNNEFSPTIGVILRPGNSTTFVDFTSDFSGNDSDGSATMDTFKVPEPASLTIFGLMALAGRRRRKAPMAA